MASDGVALVLRVAALLLTLLFTAWAAMRDGSAMLTLLGITAIAAALWSLRSHLLRTDRALARFVSAIAHNDLGQRFGGSGSPALDAALDAAMIRLGQDRAGLAESARYHAALVEETPVALLVVGADGRVALVNGAARRLFGARDGIDRAGFADVGPDFAAALDPARPAAPRLLATLALRDGTQRAMLSTSAIARPGLPARLIAVEPIQRELAAAEVGAQADLVRVLTHEIMNSMTPVTSLARSAADLIARLPDDGSADLADARHAIDIAARRAEGLLGFVGSYRQFATLPPVHLRTFPAADWGRELGEMLAAAPYGRGVAFALSVDPADLALRGDPDQLTQATLNLLKNAAEAAAGTHPAIKLTLAADPEGVTIQVDDNGPGIPAALAQDMFLPFFTTKPQGTGVGLSIARRIAVAHGGAITAGTGTNGGGRVTISVPA